MTHEWITPEVRAQALSGTPTVALTWARLVQDGETWEAWTRLDDDFRLTLSQFLARAHGLDGAEREAAASQIARRDQPVEVWDDVEPIILHELRQLIALLHGREYGAGGRTRPVGIDLELIALTPLDLLAKDENGVAYLPPGESADSVGVVLRFTPERTWVVTGFAHAMPRPGAEPAFVPLD